VELEAEPVFEDDHEAYELLLRAVDLQALVHNMLMTLSEPIDWPRFWRKVHEVREALNRPESERIRVAYVRALARAVPGSVPVGSSSLVEDPERYIDERFRNAKRPR
jgi:hypothetical protein